MKYKVLLAVAIYTSATFGSLAAYYNTIKIDGFLIGLNKVKLGVVDIISDELKITASCKIENWKDAMSLGAGILSLTSDGVGIIVSSTNQYLKVQDLKDCNGKSIKLYGVSYFDHNISTLIDINFEKKLVLALVVIDAQSGANQAIVSSFNGNKNILSGKGFWNPAVKNLNILDDTFPVIDDIYVGKISANGKYIAPNDLDCAADSFPGVWDIVKKMKVVFPGDKDDAAIDNKCRQLFLEDKKLDELGGKLINTK